MDPKIDLPKLAALIKDIKFTMFSTVNDDGSIISRPMATQELDERSFDGRLWFFTKRDTLKVHSIEHDSHVNLTYAGGQSFTSISGRAFITDDKEKMKELWSPILKSWFPEGVDDPQITLIAVDIERAEVWDAPTSKIIQRMEVVRSVLTGRPSGGSSTGKTLELHRPQ